MVFVVVSGISCSGYNSTHTRNSVSERYTERAKNELKYLGLWLFAISTRSTATLDVLNEYRPVLHYKRRYRRICNWVRRERFAFTWQRAVE